MFKYLLTILILYPFITNAQWEIQNPFCTKNLNSVFLINSANGWAIGDSGTILKYDGFNWLFQQIGTKNKLNCITFTDSAHGWLGHSNGILKYNGYSWLPDTTCPNYNIISICFVDSNQGWAISSSRILRYNGKEWAVINNSATNTSYYTIFFTDSTHGWVAGRYLFNGFISGRIYKYDGTSWTLETLPTSDCGTVKALCFIDNTHGWASCSKSIGAQEINGYILKYNGSSWVEPYNASDINSLKFVDSKHGWAVGGNRNILFYNGAEWKTEFSPALNSLNCVQFRDSTIGWAVGMNGTILKYNENNKTKWSFLNGGLTNSLYSLQVLDSTSGWAFGAQASALKYNGKLWDQGQLYSDSFAIFHSIYAGYFLNSNYGWAVGSYGTYITFFKCNNSLWSEDNTSIAYSTIRSIYFTDTTHGYAVGDYGNIFKYDGITWSKENNPLSYTYNNLRSVFFTDSNHGWAVGDRHVLKYNEGSWSIELKDTTISLYSVFFLDNQHGWAVGDKGIILVYTGTNWISQTIDTNYTFNSVFFTDSTHGWAISNRYPDSRIYKYNGTNWILQQQFRLYSSLYSICFIDSLHGWVSGDNGIIYKTINGGNTFIKDNTFSFNHNANDDNTLTISPDPCNVISNISFKVQKPGLVSLNIYDVFGQEITSIASDYYKLGNHNLPFVTDNLKNGTYFCKLDMDGKILVKRITVIK